MFFVIGVIVGMAGSTAYYAYRERKRNNLRREYLRKMNNDKTKTAGAPKSTPDDTLNGNPYYNEWKNGKK